MEASKGGILTMLPNPLGQPCDICGDIGFFMAIVTCSKCCRSREHIYCMHPNLNKLPESWYCEACICPKTDHCQRNGLKGGKTHAMGVRHVSFKIPDASVSHSCKPAGRLLSRNFVPKEVETGKVKFIPLEDIHTVPSKTKPKKPLSQGFPSSQMLSLGMKFRPSARKTSVASPENQHASKSSGQPRPPVVVGMKTVTPGNQTVKLLQPLHHIKSPSHFPCNRSSTSESTKSATILTIREQKHISDEVHHSPLDHIGAVVHGVKKKCKSKDVSLGMAKNKGKVNYLLSKAYESKEDSVDAIVPYDQDGISSSKALFKIMKQDLPNPPAEHAAWKGLFQISDFLHEPCKGLQAYPPEQVSRKAYFVSKQMPEILQFTLLPRCTVWPEIFHRDSPSGFDIGLYFHSDTFSRSRENYNLLLRHMEEKDLSMQSLLDGVRLLIFTSKLLPAESQRMNKQCYLWGVFTTKHLANVTCKIDDQLVAMEIDMAVGKEVGTTDKSLRRSSNRENMNAPPGFSKLAKLQERASPSTVTPRCWPRGSTKKIKAELDSI